MLPFLAVVNSAYNIVVNSGARLFSNYGFLQVCAQEWSRLLDHVTALLLIFKGISLLFFIATAPIYIPTSSVEGSLFSSASPELIVCRFFADDHFDQV